MMTKIDMLTYFVLPYPSFSTCLHQNLTTGAKWISWIRFFSKRNKFWLICVNFKSSCFFPIWAIFWISDFWGVGKLRDFALVNSWHYHQIGGKLVTANELISCRTTVQNHSQDIDIATVKILHIPTLTGIPHAALLWLYPLSPTGLPPHTLLKPWQSLLYSPLL